MLSKINGINPQNTYINTLSFRGDIGNLRLKSPTPQMDSVSFKGADKGSERINNENLPVITKDDPIIKNIRDNLDKLTNCSICNQDGNDVLLFNLGDTRYKVKTHIAERFPKYQAEKSPNPENGVLGFKNPTVTVREPGKEEKSYQVPFGLEISVRIDDTLHPSIEREYGLDKDLNITNLVNSLTDQTKNGKLSWEKINDNRVSFDKDLSIEAKNASRTILPEDTALPNGTVLPKGTEVIKIISPNPLKTSELQEFLGLRKPGGNPQIIGVYDEKEKEAFSRLNQAIQKKP